MPYKSEKKIIKNTKYDKRIKLSNSDKEKIKQLYSKGSSIRGLARYFKVDKRLIQFILFPERQIKNLLDREKRGGWKQYYDTKKHKEYVKKHRRYKQNLSLEGKI